MGKREGKLWSLQEQLPRLPVPNLEESLKGYVEVLRALVGKAEVNEAEDLARDFLKNEGPVLQAKLLELKAACDKAAWDGSEYPDTTWLERYWEEVAYMQARDPIAIHLNVMVNAFDDAPTPNRLQRLAWFIHGTLSFKRLVDSGELTPDKAMGAPVCSAQYARLFGVTRVPQKECDKLVVHDASTHCVVERNGHFYKLEIVGQSAASIEDALKRIEADADGRPEPELGRGGVQALTAMDRDSWAVARLGLPSAFLEAVETALFAVALTPHKPQGSAECFIASSHNHGQGIWFDKGFTVLCHENGVVGLNVEHSPIDAGTAVRMIAHACEYTTAAAGVEVGCARVRSVKLADPIDVVKAETGPCDWCRIDLGPASAETAEAVRIAKGSLGALIGKTKLNVLNYKGFGSREMKQMRCGPDAFVQLILQLAYKRDQGVTPSTYETASIRRFLHGRTETLRVTSEASVAFVDAMGDRRASDEQRAALMRKAMGVHKERLGRCMDMKGFDRHLMALRMTAASLGMPTPRLFAHKAYRHLCNITLSTSQLAGGGIDSRGFNAPSPDAYGVTYRIHDDFIQFNVSCNSDCARKDIHRWSRTIAASATDIMAMLRRAPASDSKL